MFVSGQLSRLLSFSRQACYVEGTDELGRSRESLGLLAMNVLLDVSELESSNNRL